MVHIGNNFQDFEGKFSLNGCMNKILFDKFICRSEDYFLGNRPSLKFIKLFKEYIHTLSEIQYERRKTKPVTM